MRTLLGPGFAHWRAMIGLIVVIIVPIACAGWLNAWQVFAFPLGTFLVAVFVPLGIIFAGMIAPRSIDEENFDQ